MVKTCAGHSVHTDTLSLKQEKNLFLLKCINELAKGKEANVCEFSFMTCPPLLSRDIIKAVEAFSKQTILACDPLRFSIGGWTKDYFTNKKWYVMSQSCLFFLDVDCKARVGASAPDEDDCVWINDTWFFPKYVQLGWKMLWTKKYFEKSPNMLWQKYVMEIKAQKLYWLKKPHHDAVMLVYTFCTFCDYNAMFSFGQLNEY